jgi:hypothetical protein
MEARDPLYGSAVRGHEGFGGDGAKYVDDDDDEEDE